ncbi:hypothetical protein AVEN_243184-1 [Araneus ventricosus]|uniref:Uncharacterized protein n=1 Tax=Araneus ventricosus TaxID=182803 RepID=A0A4Y2EY10_ARAVE|nr:hypothetical protein AVEN_243184-1 [Araneus ventricosus]
MALFQILIRFILAYDGTKHKTSRIVEVQLYLGFRCLRISSIFLLKKFASDFVADHVMLLLILRIRKRKGESSDKSGAEKLVSVSKDSVEAEGFGAVTLVYSSICVQAINA